MLYNEVKKNTDEILSTSSFETPVNTIWESLKTRLLTARELHFPSRKIFQTIDHQRMQASHKNKEETL